jgi:hypothetical protein
MQLGKPLKKMRCENRRALMRTGIASEASVEGALGVVAWVDLDANHANNKNTINENNEDTFGIGIELFGTDSSDRLWANKTA